MCLAIPQKVIEVKKDEVVLENPNKTIQVAKKSINLEVGDFCLTQQGIVIDKIERKDAEKFFKILEEKE